MGRTESNRIGSGPIQICSDSFTLCPYLVVAGVMSDQRGCL